jgi:hypothetical protein
MTDVPTGNGTSKVLLIAVAAVAVLALIGWSFGLFGGGQVEESTTYEADAIDESGGELIVPDPADTGIAVELPETPMTPVPPEESPAPAPE